MKHTIKNGGHLELLNQAELDESLGRVATSITQEQARGLGTARLYGEGTPAAGALSIPSPGDAPIGPETGFAWAVQRITADGLAAGDVLKVYRGNMLLGVLTPTQSLEGSKARILRSGESLTITGTALTATGQIVINGEAIETSELDLWKSL